MIAGDEIKLFGPNPCQFRPGLTWDEGRDLFADGSNRKGISWCIGDGECNYDGKFSISMKSKIILFPLRQLNYIQS